eukprot:2613253-Alexandrium_andersonii.AAC.1
MEDRSSLKACVRDSRPWLWPRQTCRPERSCAKAGSGGARSLGGASLVGDGGRQTGSLLLQ